MPVNRDDLKNMNDHDLLVMLCERVTNVCDRLERHDRSILASWLAILTLAGLIMTVLVKGG